MLNRLLFPSQIKSKFQFSLWRKQVSKFDIHFNHKRDCRYSWLCIMTSTLIMLFHSVLKVILWHDSLLSLLFRFGVNFVHFGTISAVTSLIIFMRSLCERFTALNTLLRWFPLFWIECSEYFRMLFFITCYYRSRFLRGNAFKVSTNIYRKDSIDVIKFVGRQHAFLTDIMDQLNYCYGFQVIPLASCAFESNSKLRI